MRGKSLEAQAVYRSLAYSHEEPARPSVSFSRGLVTESTPGPRSGVWTLYGVWGSVLVEDSSLTQAGRACCTTGCGVWLHRFPCPPHRKSRVCESGKRIDRKLQTTAA